MAGLCKGGNEPAGSLEAICDNAGEMSPGSSTESYPAFARIGLRENPEKISTRSPDLTCLDFFLWGHMKQLVYETVVETEEDLVARITIAADAIANMPGIFERTRQSMIRRCTARIQANGREFEQFL
ncbi:hypothetical protein ANN_05719 [Periplaneta americana]|uniref:Per a allergen n=1 Tax=Periplaneta americana TaxID=6978 RepID=A0ABQ8TDL5_PERAM|nr:hypothetical protein ANN_05719 [Periplaneta americana]